MLRRILCRLAVEPELFGGLVTARNRRSGSRRDVHLLIESAPSDRRAEAGHYILKAASIRSSARLADVSVVVTQARVGTIGGEVRRCPTRVGGRQTPRNAHASLRRRVASLR